VGLAAPPLSGSAAARKAPEASDEEKPVDKEKPVMTTILFAFGMIFLVPQLFLIGLWTMGKIIVLTDYHSSGPQSAPPITESA
jgi:hypothetical protein